MHMNNVLSAVLGVSGEENRGVLSEASIFWGWETFQSGSERDWAVQSTCQNNPLKKKKKQLFTFILFKYSLGELSRHCAKFRLCNTCSVFFLSQVRSHQTPCIGGCSGPCAASPLVGSAAQPSPSSRAQRAHNQEQTARDWQTGEENAGAQGQKWVGAVLCSSSLMLDRS